MIRRAFVANNQERAELDYLTVTACGQSAKVIYYVSIDETNYNFVCNYTALWPWQSWSTGKINFENFDELKGKIIETVSAEIAVNCYVPRPEYQEAKIFN